MKNYRYKAIDNEGNYRTGKISASNTNELFTIIEEDGLELISYRQELDIGLKFITKINDKDLITFFIHLEQLERSGVPIIESITDLKETTESAALKNLTQEIIESIKSGNLFSQTIAKHPEIFRSIYVGLIDMGEKTGNLAESFKNIIDDIKWNVEIKRKTRKAMIGPIFGILIMFLVLGVMTTVTIPKITGFLSAQNLNLPTSTNYLLNFSNFFTNYWHFMLFTIPFIFLLSKIIAKSSKNLAVIIDDIKLKIPVFGSIIRKIESAKFCQFFSMTFKSGLGIIECLELSSELIKNKAIKNSISKISKNVSDGLSLGDSIQKTKYFPNLVVRMFRVGEESGNMENSLTNIKFFYDNEINDSIDRITGLIRPVLTLIMGGMIAWIAIAVFGPVYSSFSNLQ